MYTVYIFCIPILLVILMTHWREPQYQLRMCCFGASSYLIIFKRLTKEKYGSPEV